MVQLALRARLAGQLLVWVNWVVLGLATATVSATSPVLITSADKTAVCPTSTWPKLSDDGKTLPDAADTNSTAPISGGETLVRPKKSRVGGLFAVVPALIAVAPAVSM